MAKRLNPNLVKKHRNYTVGEIAGLFGNHNNTIRTWIKQGLPVIDGIRPTLILGRDLRTFLQAKRQKHKQVCAPDEMYCLRCRKPQRPADGLVEYKALTSSTGRLTGVCSVCDCLINQFSSLAHAEHLQHKLNTTLPKTLLRIDESDQPLLNSDFNQRGET